MNERLKDVRARLQCQYMQRTMLFERHVLDLFIIFDLILFGLKYGMSSAFEFGSFSFCSKRTKHFGGTKTLYLHY